MLGFLLSLLLDKVSFNLINQVWNYFIGNKAKKLLKDVWKQSISDPYFHTLKDNKQWLPLLVYVLNVAPLYILTLVLLAIVVYLPHIIKLVLPFIKDLIQ